MNRIEAKCTNCGHVLIKEISDETEKLISILLHPECIITCPQCKIKYKVLDLIAESKKKQIL